MVEIYFATSSRLINIVVISIQSILHYIYKSLLVQVSDSNTDFQSHSLMSCQLDELGHIVWEPRELNPQPSVLETAALPLRQTPMSAPPRLFKYVGDL